MFLNALKVIGIIVAVLVILFIVIFFMVLIVIAKIEDEQMKEVEEIMQMYDYPYATKSDNHTENN